MAMPREVSLNVALYPTEPPQRIAELAKLADNLGYSRVFVGDSQLIWREAYVNLTVAALSTSRAMIGTGVTNCVTRDVSVIASALATLDELTGGRVFLGIGLGDSSLRTAGKRHPRLERLEQTIDALRRLYRGERVERDAAQIHLAYRQPGSELSVLVGANGPKMLQLAGRVADGAILSGGLHPGYLEFNLRHLEQGASSVGRDLQRDGFRFVAHMACSIDRDSQVAKDAVRAHVARVVNRDLPITLSPREQEIIARLRREYDWYHHLAVGSKHGELVPDELVAGFAIAGTPDECRQQVSTALARGEYLNEITIIPYASDPAKKADIIRSFAEEVMGIAART